MTQLALLLGRPLRMSADDDGSYDDEVDRVPVAAAGDVDRPRRAHRAAVSRMRAVRVLCPPQRKRKAAGILPPTASLTHRNPCKGTEVLPWSVVTEHTEET